MNEVFETVAEVLEELRSEAEEREYSVHTNESENADKALKKANREYETVLAELSAEHREFFENYMDIVDHAHFQEEQRAYYQGMIDLNLLERGADYKELKKSYVIFICPFDQFQEGLHKYTFENQCKEIPELVLGDESTKIFLCAGGHADDVSDEMKDFLNWLTTGQTGNSQFVNKLENAVLKAKKHEEWKVEYMTLLMRDNEMMEKGRNDMLFSLVQDGTLSLEIAATKAEMPVEKFAKAMKEAGYFIRELP